MFAIININPILLYAFQGFICSAIFYLFYRGVIEPGRHFTLCRLYLLFALVAPVVIPLLSVPIFPASLSPNPESLVYTTTPIATNPFIEATSQTKIDLFMVGILIYLAICGLLTVKLGLQLRSILRVFQSGSIHLASGCLIVRSSKVKTPFSFFRTIYFPKTLDPVDEKIFLLHEHAHIRNRHSIDILLCEVLSIFFWFNPIFRLMGKEFKKIHEYQADRAVTSSEDFHNIHLYKTLIVNEFLGFSPKIANAFNQSITKKRIMMLSQPFKTNHTIVRMALIVPVIAINLLLFSCTARDPQAGTDLVDPQTKIDLSQAEIIRFEIVEKKPTFQGGDENDFSKWVGQQIIYPEAAKENEIQGRVMLSFVVDTEGNVQDVTVLRGVDPLLDNEAIRVVSSSPKWTPGEHEGRVANVRYNFPIIFMLDSGKNATQALSQQLETLVNMDKENGVYLFTTVGTKPAFQGGDLNNDFAKWVSQQIVYPEAAKKNGIQGSITLSFVVNMEGNVQDVTVLRGVDPLLDAEAIRVVSSSPKWTPGKHEEKKVPVRYYFPVVFQLR